MEFVPIFDCDRLAPMLMLKNCSSTIQHVEMSKGRRGNQMQRKLGWAG